MKTLIKTIIILITINLITTGVSIAQEAAQLETDIARAEVETKEARERLEENMALREQLKALEKLSVPHPAPSQVSVSVPDFVLPSFTNGTSSGDSVLVIPMNQMETEDVIAINEDMNVMSRIFEENLSKAGLGTTGNTMFYGYGRNPFFDVFGHGHSNLQTMYIQGYGAIFMMNVDFPLTPPPPEPNEVEEETDTSTDQVWEQTKNQMFSPPETRRGSNRTPQKEYDAEKVERLKATLIKSLRHAANIRAVQQEESVVVTITGSGDSANSPTVTRKIVVEGNMVKASAGSGSADIEMAPPTKLVIRVKKSDIDAVSDGQIDMENFLGKVQILDCPYLSSNLSQISTSSRRSTTPSRGRSSGSSTRGMYGEQR